MIRTAIADLLVSPALTLACYGALSERPLDGDRIARIKDVPMRDFTGLRRDRRGATAIEYGLIAALGEQLATTFTNVSDNMKAS